jgi:hypothetical protein
VRARRAKEPASIATRSDKIWTVIDTNLQRGTGHTYDRSLRSLTELADALIQAGRAAELRQRLAKLMSAHGNRPA